MARIRKLVRKSGAEVFQVRWIKGGSRGGREANENFGDETSAATFKDLVDANGQHWPPGWVRGQGFVDAQPAAEEKPRSVAEACYAHVSLLTGVEGRTRHDYERMIRLHIEPHFEGITAAACTEEDILRWVQWQEAGEQAPGEAGTWLRRPASPKSIANRHGLLYSAFQRLTEGEAPIRSSNPCARTRLPRTDDEIDDEMVFLEHAEYQRIRAELAAIFDGDVVDIADVLVGTGLRWGELTALQPQDLRLDGPTPTLRVQRAWKRQADNSFELGKPKSKKSRRTIALSPGLVDAFRRHIIGKQVGDLVFLTAQGNPWRHSNFRERRWLPAIRAAQRKGLTKAPRPHDLRHTHVAWLIAARVPLPAIQARLGHESITTTVDRYGHLVRELDSQITAAVEQAMNPGLPQDGGLRIVS